jgi:hypothetical protein
MVYGFGLGCGFKNGTPQPVTSNINSKPVKLVLFLARPYAPAMETALVQCPTCFETFEVVMPPPEELPAEMDYDCEICCRPLILVFDESGAYARGIGE